MVPPPSMLPLSIDCPPLPFDQNLFHCACTLLGPSSGPIQILCCIYIIWLINLYSMDRPLRPISHAGCEDEVQFSFPSLDKKEQAQPPTAMCGANTSLAQIAEICQQLLVKPSVISSRNAAPMLLNDFLNRVPQLACTAAISLCCISQHEGPSNGHKRRCPAACKSHDQHPGWRGDSKQAMPTQATSWHWAHLILLH